jgi:hypothetical protein
MTHAHHFHSLPPLLALLCGCATIAKGPYASVEVIAPRDIAVSTVDGTPIPLSFGKDSTRWIRLSTDSTQHVVLSRDSARTVYVLEPRLDGQWIAVDFFTPAFLGLAIDAATRSWYDFGDVAIVHTRDSSGVSTILASEDSIVEARRRPPFGIILVGGFGVSNPVAQAVLLGNHYTAALGWSFTDRVALLASLCGQGCIELEDYRGTTGHRPHFYCNVSSIELGLDVRYRVAAGLYLLAGAGRSSVESSDSVVGPSYLREAARFRERISYVSGAIGYAGGIWMIEVRNTRGLERIPIGGDVTGALNLWTFHFGLNVNI